MTLQLVHKTHVFEMTTIHEIRSSKITLPLPCACPEPCQVHLCPVYVVEAAHDVTVSAEWEVVRLLVVTHQAPPGRPPACHPGRPRCPSRR